VKLRRRVCTLASVDAIDADLICLSSHLAVTTKAGAADEMASRVASPTKIAA
jgi:hypothetical protein